MDTNDGKGQAFPLAASSKFEAFRKNPQQSIAAFSSMPGAVEKPCFTGKENSPRFWGGFLRQWRARNACFAKSALLKSMPASFPREVRTRGYVIRTCRLTDTSLIVDWLTEREGRISTVARGAFRKKSAFAGKLDWLFCAEISYQRSRASNLHALKEVELRAAPSQIRRSVSSLNQIAYFVELIRRATETETPIPDIFQLFHQAVRQAEQGVLGVSFILWFEWRLLDILGLHPAINDGRLDEDCRQILTLWSRSPEKFPHERPIHPPQIARLGSLFAKHWIAEIGRCPSLRNRLLQ